MRPTNKNTKLVKYRSYVLQDDMWCCPSSNKYGSSSAELYYYFAKYIAQRKGGPKIGTSSHPRYYTTLDDEE